MRTSMAVALVALLAVSPMHANAQGFDQLLQGLRALVNPQAAALIDKAQAIQKKVDAVPSSASEAQLRPLLAEQQELEREKSRVGFVGDAVEKAFNDLRSSFANKRHEFMVHRIGTIPLDRAGRSQLQQIERDLNEERPSRLTEAQRTEALQKIQLRKQEVEAAIAAADELDRQREEAERPQRLAEQKAREEAEQRRRAEEQAKLEAEKARIAAEQKVAAERLVRIKAGALPPQNFAEAIVATSPTEKLIELMVSPLLQPDKGIYANGSKPDRMRVSVDGLEAKNLLRVRFWSVFFGERHEGYALLRLGANTKNFAPDRMRVGALISVIGRYVDNVSYRTVAGQQKTAPVFDVLYIGD